MIEELNAATYADIDAAPFQWPAQAPDLFDHLDRKMSERDFALALVAPLAVLAGLAGSQGGGWGWAAVVLGTVAVASFHKYVSARADIRSLVWSATLAGRVKGKLAEVVARLDQFFIDHHNNDPE